MSEVPGPILVVEDIPHLLELIEMTLRLEGYPVITARDGEEALKLVSEERPSLILTDLMMPKLDGFAFAQRVRRNPATQYIPILFISATYVTEEDRQFALSLGAVGFLEKPVDAEELLLAVGENLTREEHTAGDPLPEEAFITGYQARLQAKLEHKELQLTRARRLVETVPQEQRPIFETMLAKTIEQRDQIKAHLLALGHTLRRHGPQAPE